MQDQYNLINRGEELEMFGLLADRGVGSIPWSPLAQGVLTRPWGDRTTNRGAREVDRFGRPLWQDTDEAITDAVQHTAEDRGVSMAQVGLAWVLKNPVVDAPIVGVTKQHHLTDAATVIDLQLDDEEITALETPYVLRQATWFRAVPNLSTSLADPSQGGLARGAQPPSARMPMVDRSTTHA
jgi:1-deoxyxylulose-5-phosphate synthase